MDEAKSKWGLKLASKEEAVVSVLSCISSVENMDKSLLKHGFLANEMIDKGSGQIPDLGVLLEKRLWRDLSKDKLKTAHNALSILMRLFEKKGHISEDELKELGLSTDRDFQNNEVAWTATVQQEWLQWAKWLDHDYQMFLHTNVKKKALEKLVSKKMNQNSSLHKNFFCNKNFKSKILETMTKDHPLSPDEAERDIAAGLLVLEEPSYLVKR